MANKRSKTNSKGMTEGQISTPTSDFDKRVKSLSRRVLISVCAMLISAVGLAVSALSVKLYPWIWCFATWVGLGFTQVRSLAQIAAFGLPGGRSTQKHLESDIRSDVTNPSTAIYPNSPSGHVSAIQLATPREPHTATLPNSVEISPRGSPSMMSHPSPMILPQPYHHDDNLTPRIPEDGKPMYRDDYIAIAPIQLYSHEPVITPRPQEDAYDLRVVNNQQY